MSSRLPRQQPAASACGVNDGSMRATCTLRAVSRAVFAVSTTLKVAPILVPCWNPRRAEEEGNDQIDATGQVVQYRALQSHAVSAVASGRG